MKNYKIKIPIDPVPASRPRITRSGGVYYNEKHTQFTKDIRKMFEVGIIKAPYEPKKALFRVDIVYYIQIPKTIGKVRKNEILGNYCDKNIDLDNLDKITWDEILTGKFIEDDRYIVDGSHKKIWAEEGKIEIIINEL